MSAYLALLHGVTEESVKQQVLQLSILVKRLFDFPQEDTEGQGKDVDRRWQRGKQRKYSSFMRRKSDFTGYWWNAL